MTKKAKRRGPSAAKAGAPAPGVSSRWCFVALGVVILFFSLIRIRLLSIPLERDEGEYAYAGQLILQGIPPYRLAYNMKLPGTYAAYSLIMSVFGQSPAAIHAGLLLVNAATVILLFLIVRRLFGPLAGVAAGSSYALLSTSESVLGFAAHATHFVALAALGGILVLLEAMERRRMSLYFVSGFLLGLAFVLKQPGLFFALFGGSFMIVQEWRGAKDWRGLGPRLAVFSAAAIIPFALTCAILYFAGVLDKMWFWTFSYGTQYASVMSLSQGLQQFLTMAPLIAEPALIIWILAGVGLAALVWDSRIRQHAVFAIGFLLFSWAAVCPGLYFREHYFILVLPAICVFVAIAVSSGAHELSQRSRNPTVAAIPILVLVAAMAVSVYGQSEVFFQLDPLAVCRRTYGPNPFPEAQAISEYLDRQTSEDARIAVLGSEPEIYFYSKRHSATGFIYTYPLMERQKYAVDMQKDMAKEIEDNRPQYMVFVQIPVSWAASPSSSMMLLEWFHKFAADHYAIDGVVDEITPTQTRYIWGDAARSYHTESGESIWLFKRRDN